MAETKQTPPPITADNNMPSTPPKNEQLTLFSIHAILKIVNFPALSQSINHQKVKECPMISRVIVSSSLEIGEYNIQLNEERNGSIEFETKGLNGLDPNLHIDGYDAEYDQEERLPLHWLHPQWEFEEQDSSFESGIPLEAYGLTSAHAGLHITWRVALSLDHVAPANEDGPGYNVYNFHHTVLIRKMSPEELQEAIEYENTDEYKELKKSVDKLQADLWWFNFPNEEK